jgi:hypothetical protein
MKPKKRPIRAALPRICFIDRETARGRFPNTNIGRDIAFMIDQMEAPIKYRNTPLYDAASHLLDSITVCGKWRKQEEEPHELCSP